jgi:thioredoxin 2
MNQTESRIVRCTGCGAKNRVPLEKIGTSAKCGKCGTQFDTAADRENGPAALTIRCTACRAKNRLPADKIQETAKCGKCKVPLETQALFKRNPVMATDGNFDQIVLKAPLPVLLYCWSTNCPHCRATGPIVDQFAAESKGRVRVAKLNVDANPGVASRYNVMGVPFLFVFDNGQLKESLPGTVPKHEIMMKVGRYLYN